MSNVNRRVLVKKLMAMSIAINTLSFWPASAQRGDNIQRNHKVTISGLKFSPEHLTVRVGDKITWINQDIAPHTATATDKSWDTGNLRRGETVSVIVTDGFAEKYYCRFHPMMKASIKIVTE